MADLNMTTSDEPRGVLAALADWLLPRICDGLDCPKEDATLAIEPTLSPDER